MVWLSQCHSIFFQHAAESMTGCGAVPRNVARSSWRTAICHDMARGVDAEAARPQIVRSWRGLRAAKNGLLARFIRCVKERRRWRRHPISREAPSERRMIACPSGGFRVQPRKYYFFWTAKGRTARGEMERTSTGSIHSLLDANSVRTRVSRAGGRDG